MVLAGDWGLSDVYVYQGCNSKGEGGEDQAQRIKNVVKLGQIFLVLLTLIISLYVGRYNLGPVPIYG